jgi:hypothetical protein
MRHLGEDEIVEGEIAPFQGALVQESQRRDPHLDSTGLKLLLLQQVSLIMSQVLCAQVFRRAVEVLGKLPDGTEIAADGGRRVVSPLKARAACAGEVGS